MPRSSDAVAASRAIPAAVAKTMVRPWWNGAEIRFGKNSLPVISCAACGDRELRTPVGPSSVCSGFAPRKAVKTVETAGSCAAWCAAVGSTPWLISPVERAPGSRPASPVMSSEKKTPMDSDIPAFWKVERMPEAAPRCSAGTLLMMAEVFGAENIPEPKPLSMISRAKAQYGKFSGRKSRPMKLAANRVRPPVVNRNTP